LTGRKPYEFKFQPFETVGGFIKKKAELLGESEGEVDFMKRTTRLISVVGFLADLKNCWD
jgi:hypothetical protein